MLVSHVICFGYLMPMSYGVNKNALLIFSPTFFPYQVFTRFVCRFTRNTFFWSDHITAKIFQCKTNFFIQLIAVRFWFYYFLYIFLKVLFHSSVIMKLRIASFLYICIAFYLDSHQIMRHNKRIHGQCLKNTSWCCFFVSQGR